MLTPAATLWRTLADGANFEASVTLDFGATGAADAAAKLEQAQALAMLVLSWRPADVPAAYLAGAPRTDKPTPEQLAEEERMRTGPGAWFVETGCSTCHSIQVYGVKSPAQIGPDLSNAVEDVQSRFGRTIDAFLREPTGTMSVVLSRQIILTPEQKAIAIQKLREAFAVYQKQQAEKKER